MTTQEVLEKKIIKALPEELGLCLDEYDELRLKNKQKLSIGSRISMGVHLFPRYSVFTPLKTLAYDTSWEVWFSQCLSVTEYGNGGMEIESISSLSGYIFGKENNENFDILAFYRFSGGIFSPPRNLSASFSVQRD